MTKIGPPSGSGPGGDNKDELVLETTNKYSAPAAPAIPDVRSSEQRNTEGDQLRPTSKRRTSRKRPDAGLVGGPHRA
jgi:hypothetical protein